MCRSLGMQLHPLANLPSPPGPRAGGGRSHGRVVEGANEPVSWLFRSDASDAWREPLSRRLLTLTVVLTLVAYLPITIATSTSTTRAVLTSAGLVIALGLVALAMRRVGDRVRSVAVVATFLLIGVVGYLILGSMSGPGIGFASAVAFAGLLLGRRAMYLTILAVGCLASGIAVGMVQGVLPLPDPADISPASGVTWFRSTVITLILISILASAVVHVVESIEATRRRAAVEEQRRHDAELQLTRAQSMQLLARLAAGLAHDVNNQLTVVSSWSSIAAVSDDPVERSNAAGAIHLAVDQASSLTRQLLLLARRDTATPVPVELGRFLEANAAMLQFVTARNVVLEVDVAAGMWCRIDPSQLSQVVVNLAMNACEAMPDGGRLMVGARREVRRSEGWICFEVRDTGVGMTPEVAAQAIEPFFSTKAEAGGTGLGLATVAVIAEAVGGTLSIESAPDEGTTVRILFPECEPQIVLGDAGRSHEVDLTGTRVLMVDDNGDVLEAAGRVLGAAFADVVTASDGDEAISAIDAAASGTIDVLCTDVVMTGARAGEVIDRYRRRHGGGVVVCSGYVGETLIRHGVEEGEFALLRKPFTPEGLLRAIADARVGDLRTRAVE